MTIAHLVCQYFQGSQLTRGTDLSFETWGALHAWAWSPLGSSVSVGMWGERPRPGVPGTEVPGFPGTVHIPWSPPGLPTSPLPSPSLTHHIAPSYLWAQCVLWGLVCLEVPCSPASLRGPHFQLIQEYLEALRKRTSPVSDIESLKEK